MAQSKPGAAADDGPRPIRHVGVCIDRSPTADRILPHGIAIAQAFHARLTVLHALEPTREGSGEGPADLFEWEAERTEARRHLTALQEAHGTADLSLEGELLEGHPAEEIRDWVVSHGVDLTVLCSHGASGWTEWSLASTARKMIEGIPGSVLLVPAWSVQELRKSPVQYRRILVPLDGSPRAECALPLASQLARAHGSELLLLHVVPTPDGACPCSCLQEPQERELEQRLVDRNTRAAGRYLELVRERLGATTHARSTVSVDGDPRSEILRFIAEQRVDLVVLSGHGHGGHTELPFGSVASFLLEHATAPLLLVRTASDPPRRGMRPATKSSTGGRLPPLATA